MTKDGIILTPHRIRWTSLGWVIAASIYVQYLSLSIIYNKTGIDYSTFMEIGQRWLSGQAVYTVNSYYPLPYVAIFAAFSSLPGWLSILLWSGIPVVAAVAISGPWALLFAPLFGHFVGGQSSLVGMLGIWGFRRYPRSILGGGLLALSTLKPQLGVLPLAWAIYEWIREYRFQRKIPRSFLGFLLFASLLWIPSFFFYPDWISDWMASPRPLAFRAMAGLFPRTLLLVMPQSILYFAILIPAAGSLLWVIRRKWSFEVSLLWYCVISPFAHDYDLIFLLPILKTNSQRLTAVLLSIPTWLVIIFAYTNNFAWFLVTLIPVGLLVYFVGFDKHLPPNQTWLAFSPKE